MTPFFTVIDSRFCQFISRIPEKKRNENPVWPRLTCLGLIITWTILDLSNLILDSNLECTVNKQCISKSTATDSSSCVVDLDNRYIVTMVSIINLLSLWILIAHLSIGLDLDLDLYGLARTRKSKSSRSRSRSRFLDLPLDLDLGLISLVILFL